MSIDAFTKTVKQHITDAWLKSIEANIISHTTEELRASQQVSGKTDLLLSGADLQNIYKTISGEDLSLTYANDLVKELTENKNIKARTSIQKIINRQGVEVDAYLFNKVGWDWITNKINVQLNKSEITRKAMAAGYKQAEDDYVKKHTAILLSTVPDIDEHDKDFEIDKIKNDAKRAGTLGYHFNKGHVIGIATKLSQEFRDKVRKMDGLADEERNAIIGVLNGYISKLQEDDITSANLPLSVTNKIYASYIKASSNYLVELQFAAPQQLAGSASSKIISELRSLFTLSEEDAGNILKNSPALGKALLTTQGSPSFLDLIAIDIASIIGTGKAAAKEYKIPKTLVAETTTKIIKPKSNKEAIAKLKKVQAKLKAVKSEPDKIISGSQINLSALQGLINQHLQNVISANMGDGSQRNILNYRTGRFAGSVKVDRMSESRAGMITAFYNYMKNPYATFAEGGAQEDPKSRNPKLLIAKSIREIAAIKVGNRLRAVAL